MLTWTRAIIVVGPTVSVVVIAILLLLRGETTRPIRITFAGWTNVAGVKNALLLFPVPSARRPKDNFFYKRTFRFEVELLYSYENGTTAINSIENSFGSGFPLRATEILVPVTPGIKSVSILRAEGILGSYRDNSILGLGPPSPPEKRWSFTLPSALDTRQ